MASLLLCAAMYDKPNLLSAAAADSIPQETPAAGPPSDHLQNNSLPGGREGTSLRGLDQDCDGSQATHNAACAKDTENFATGQEKAGASGVQPDPALPDCSVEDVAAASHVPDQTLGHSCPAAPSEPLKQEPAADVTHEAPSAAVESQVDADSAPAAPQTTGKQASEEGLGSGDNAAPDLQRGACNAQGVTQHEGPAPGEVAAPDAQHGYQDVAMASEPCASPEPCGPHEDSGLPPVGQHGLPCSMDVDAEALPGGLNPPQGAPHADRLPPPTCFIYSRSPASQAGSTA